MASPDEQTAAVLPCFDSVTVAFSYLQKFANLFVDLPHQRQEYQLQYEAGRREYCETLLSHYDFRKKFGDQRYLATCLETLVEHFDVTLRARRNSRVPISRPGLSVRSAAG